MGNNQNIFDLRCLNSSCKWGGEYSKAISLSEEDYTSLLEIKLLELFLLGQRTGYNNLKNWSKFICPKCNSYAILDVTKARKDRNYLTNLLRLY